MRVELPVDWSAPPGPSVAGPAYCRLLTTHGGRANSRCIAAVLSGYKELRACAVCPITW